MTLINAFELATQTENTLLGLEQKALFTLAGGDKNAAANLKAILVIFRSCLPLIC